MNLSIKLNRLQRLGLIVGGAFTLLTIGGLALSPRPALISYLAAYVFWFGVALGCLNVALIHHLTGGCWGIVTRRFFEAGYLTLPVMAVLFVPVLISLRELYPWANPATVLADKILQQRSSYENIPAFILRAIFFFAVWIQIAFWLRKWSLQSDGAAGLAATARAKALSGPAMVIVPLVATFAFVDWIMSLEPSWFSTIFSLILLAGGILIAIAFGLLLLAWFQADNPFAKAITPKQILDLSNLLLAFVMFWTYLAFSQLLISYSGNQPHEITWYLHRIAGGWKWLLVFIALFQFFLPFFILLFRSYKQNLRRLAAVAALVFLVYALQIYWTIVPTFYPTGIKIHWTDFTAWLGMGGIWMATLAANLKKHPPLVRPLPETVSLTPEISHE
jgi:hypothetical protein